MKILSVNNQGNPFNTTTNKGKSTYQHFNTEEVITHLVNKYSLYEIGRSCSKPRKEENQGYQRHLVTLSSNDLSWSIDSENRVTLLLINSHDCRSSFQIRLGIYRTVCANGLIVGDTLYSTRITHVKSKEYLFSEVDRLVASIPSIILKVKLMQSILLNHDQREFLIKNIILLRLENINKENLFLNTIPLREEDSKFDLYTVFNLAQERLINGCYIEIKEEDEFNKKKLKKIKAPKTIIELNKKAWNIAESYLKVA